MMTERKKGGLIIIINHIKNIQLFIKKFNPLRSSRAGPDRALATRLCGFWSLGVSNTKRAISLHDQSPGRGATFQRMLGRSKARASSAAVQGVSGCSVVRPVRFFSPEMPPQLLQPAAPSWAGPRGRAAGMMGLWGQVLSRADRD
jgi:hypothetical protein